VSCPQLDIEEQEGEGEREIGVRRSRTDQLQWKLWGGGGREGGSVRWVIADKSVVEWCE
jgi:hypothetical protein